MGAIQSVRKISFEDIIDTIYKNKSSCLLINTLPITEQECLILHTLPAATEETAIKVYLQTTGTHQLLYTEKIQAIIVFWSNTNN